MAQSGPATPSALYKMISIPEAQDAVLAETQCLPSTAVGLADADGHILAEDVKAPEDVPPFPASIKVCEPCLHLSTHYITNSLHISLSLQVDLNADTHMQDGYAVVASDGPGEYVVAFAAHAGHQQPRLEAGSVAYITTGTPVSCLSLQVVSLASGSRACLHISPQSGASCMPARDFGCCQEPQTASDAQDAWHMSSLPF